MQPEPSSAATQRTSVFCISMVMANLALAVPPASSAQWAQEEQQKTRSAIDKREAQSAEVDRNIQAFLKRSGQNVLLGSPAAGDVQPESRESQDAENSSKSELPQKDATNDKPAKTIRINFEGGMFLDNEAGILAYLKNVKLDETSSGFKLRCSDELKLLFDKKPTKTNKADSEDSGQTGPTESKKDKSFAELGDLREIIATGNVRIAGKNSNGQPFLASGDVASYHAKNGEMIIQGGRPTLQQTANQYLQAQEDGQWIKILMSNKTIVSITTSVGKWQTQAVIKENPLNQERWTNSTCPFQPRRNKRRSPHRRTTLPCILELNQDAPRLPYSKHAV